MFLVLQSALSEFPRRQRDIVAQTLDLYDDSQDQYVSVEPAVKARAARVTKAISANPGFNASEAELEEHGTFLNTLVFRHHCALAIDSPLKRSSILLERVRRRLRETLI
jgi:hypothetical protein